MNVLFYYGRLPRWKKARENYRRTVCASPHNNRNNFVRYMNVRSYMASVNSGCVMQEGSMEAEKGLGEILQRLQAQQDGSNSSNNSEDDDEQEFHSPIKEQQTAPLLATTTDIATTQTPAAATIVAARIENQNAATAAQGDTAATATDSPIAATAAQASTAEGTPDFIDQSTPPPRGSKKRSAQPSSKSNQRKKLRKDAQCRKGAQVKVTRNMLYHVLQDDAQKESTKQCGNHHNFFGNITVGVRDQTQAWRL
jgi:hypothetical protein